jgi:hypothetical protein
MRSTKTVRTIRWWFTAGRSEEAMIRAVLGDALERFRLGRNNVLPVYFQFLMYDRLKKRI